LKEDAQLIRATLAGDSAAFGQLVTKYQDRLYNTVLQVVGSADDALDVLQETFVQAYVKLDSFGGRSAFYTWLYRIAFNQAVTHRRKMKPTVSVEHAKQSGAGEPVDNTSPPDEGLLRQERASQVRTALTKLSEEHRTILVLREVEGCCYETIAEILNVPVGTVRSRLHRARVQLKEHLEAVMQQ